MWTFITFIVLLILSFVPMLLLVACSENCDKFEVPKIMKSAKLLKPMEPVKLLKPIKDNI